MLTVRNFVVICSACLLLAASATACKKDKDKKTKKGPVPAATDAAAAKPMPAPDFDAAPAAAAMDAGEAAAASADAGGTAATPPDKTGPAAADKKPKNLKILPKSWSRKKVTVVMKRFEKSLGVKCKFCHNTKDYAADGNKHKKIARTMMKMTSALNRSYFGGKGKVSCYTCHQGKKEP